jgi:DNA-binding response OmpR family regulator
MEPKKVLIIEDDEQYREILKKTVEKEGYQVLMAVDGETGLSIAQQEHPDLILLDILLPRADGIMVFRKLREDEWGKTVRVIILTNLSHVESYRDLFERDTYVDCLIKVNVTLEEVMKKVKEALA